MRKPKIVRIHVQATARLIPEAGRKHTTPHLWGSFFSKFTNDVILLGVPLASPRTESKDCLHLGSLRPIKW